MHPVDLAEKVYNHELQLKNEISVSLAVPVAALTFMTAALGVYFVSFNFKISKAVISTLELNAYSLKPYLFVDALFGIFSILLVFFLVLSTKALFSALPEEDYQFIEFNKSFSAVIESMKNSNDDSVGESDYSVLNKKFAERLYEYTMVNSRINRERNRLRSRCVRNLRYGLYCFAASTVLFFFDKFMSEDFIVKNLISS